MSKRLLRSLLSLMVCMAMLLSLAPAVLAESADAPSTEMAVGAVDPTAAFWGCQAFWHRGLHCFLFP